MMLNRQFVWFCTVGCVGLLVDVVTLVMTRSALGIYGARAVSFLVAATATWLLNRCVTFSKKVDPDKRGSIVREYTHYLGIMATGGAVNYVAYSVLAWKFDQSPWALSVYVAIGSLVGLGVNYLGASRWLYGARSTP